MKKMGQRFGRQCAVRLMTMLAASSCLADITDWGAGNVFFLSDPSGDSTGSHGSMNITGLRYRLDAGTHYFRMDLASAPVAGPNSSAPDYLIFLDYAPGGASFGDGTFNPGLSAYVADNGAGGLSGIDAIVDMNFTLFGGDLSGYHTYSSGLSPFNFTTGLGSELGANGGSFVQTSSMLEWSLPTSTLGASAMTIYGGAQDIGGGAVTWDFTGPIHTPEPATLAVFSMVGGIVALGLRRRKA